MGTKAKEDPKRVMELSGKSPQSANGKNNGGYSKETIGVIKLELDAIKKRKGRLTAAFVLDAAKRKSSVLHKFFEWDNAKAAEHWRYQQALCLIKSVYVVYADGTRGRAFVGIGPKHQLTYASEGDIRASDSLLAQVTSSAIRELIFWCDRYEHIDGLTHVIEQVRAIVGDHVKGIEKKKDVA